LIHIYFKLYSCKLKLKKMGVNLYLFLFAIVTVRSQSSGSTDQCVGDEALNLDRCAENYQLIPEFPCYTRTIPASRIATGWNTPEECSALCDANEDCEMYAIHIRDERADNIGHCITFSYADVASGSTIQEGGSSHLKCVKSTWNYVDEHENSFSTEFFTNAEAQEMYSNGLVTSDIDCSLKFRVQRDNTESRTSFSFMALNDGRIFNVNMRGSRTNHQHWTMEDDCRTLKCYDYEQSSPRGNSGYCPSRFYSGTTPQTLPVLLLRVNFNPSPMSSRGEEQPSRNKYTFKGKYYRIRETTQEPSAAPTFAPTLRPTAEPSAATRLVCDDTLSTDDRYHLCGHMENGELVGHGWQRTTASKLISTDLSRSEKFAECQLFCESQATEGCCEFRDQNSPWCLFKEDGIPREQSTRTNGGSETYSVSCALQHNTATTTSPSRSPSESPSNTPTEVPSDSPSVSAPTENPSKAPSDSPSVSAPTEVPSRSPSESPSNSPSASPTSPPTPLPSDSPSLPTETPVTQCVGDEALNLDRCANNYEVIPEFPCYTRTIPESRIANQGGWKTPEQCSSLCDTNDDCEMYAIHIRDQRPDNIGHCILFSYADVASGLTVQEGGSPHLKCVKTPIGYSTSPTKCPTPDVGDFGGHLIDASNSSVGANGRIYLDFSYSNAIVSDFNISMDNPQYNYESAISNDWNEDLGMCWDSINREFTYNQLQKAVSFEVQQGDILFAIETEYEFTTSETLQLNGQEYQWTQTKTRGKEIPFKMHLPETSTIALAIKSNQGDISGNFALKTRRPTTSRPTLIPTVSPSTEQPTSIPTISKPTLSPSSTQPTVQPSMMPSAFPTSDQPSVRPTAFPTSEHPSVSPSLTPTTTDPSMSPSVIPTFFPSKHPSAQPTTTPSVSPVTTDPTMTPTVSKPTTTPTVSQPTATPTFSPSSMPSFTNPTVMPTYVPSSIPSVQPTAPPSTTIPSYSPSFSQPSVSPTMFPTSAEPTVIPTVSPTISPTSDSPSAQPTISPTELPSFSPLPASKVLTTIMPYMAVETRQSGQNPLVEIHFTTIIKMPWVLVEPTASGSAITGGVIFQLLHQDTCDQFSELESFLQDKTLYCQEWNLKFEGDRHCNSAPRHVSLGYKAVEPNGKHESLSYSWELDLGSSAAFECAIDLGTFEIALQIEGSSGGNKNFASPGMAFIDDWYYFRIGASSGAPVTDVSIIGLDIQSASGISLCQECENLPDLQLGISDWSPDNFVIHMMLDSSIFNGHITTTLSFTFEVKMKATAGRRRLKDSEQRVEQKVTLKLRPREGQTGSVSRPPTRYNPYSTHSPSMEPVEIPDIVEEEEITPKDLSSVAEEPGNNMSWIWILLVVGILAVFAICYKWQFGRSRTVRKGKELEMDTAFPYTGSAISIQTK